MPTTRTTAGLLALAIATLAPATAVAAPPAALPDSVAAAPTGTLDVLANDSDPDGDALSVSANGQGANGSVQCSALGACLYTATGAFTGTDSFTYTVRTANGETSTATVTVNVTAQTSQAASFARDDEAVTRAGQEVVVDVLANDTGSPVAATKRTDPQHGTVICAVRQCRYVPNAGYTGTDGFTYQAEYANERTSTAQVHVLVAPADPGFAVDATGSPASVPADGRAQWGVGIESSLNDQELAAHALPAGRAEIRGEHAVAGDPSTAPGWTGGLAGFQATDEALLGEGIAQSFPQPLPPISQGTGGDGHVPILVGSKVFAYYHHSSPTSITCVDRATGQLCPGYPKRLDVGTTDINGPGVVEGSRFYSHLEPRTGYAQSAPIALFCWDAATDSTCGMTIVDRVPATSNPGASAPVRIGNQMWFGGDTGRLYCVVPATGAPCATPSLPTGLGGTREVYWDVVSHGTRVFLARRNGNVACVDVAAGTPCPGWSTPLSFNGRWNVVNRHDASGATNGVCVFFGTQGECVTDADPSVRTPVNNFVNIDTFGQGYSHSLEAETGTRTLVGSLSRGGLGCYDWTTMAPCVGGTYQGGWVTVDSSGRGLPSAYGAAYDGACAVGLGDPGQVFTVDPAGSSPCLSLASGTDRTQVDLRDQRCDGTVGGARWRGITLSDVGEGELESVVVTVRDADTGEVLKSGDLVTGGRTLDLSGIDASAHPSVLVDATAKSDDGNAAWTDAIPPRITLSWESDPQALCFETAGTAACGANAAPISATGFLGDASDTATLDLLRKPCPLAATPPSAAPVKPRSTPNTTTRRPKCKSRRFFPINVRAPGKRIKSISVKYDNRKQKVLRVKPRPRIQINLRGLGKRKVVVKIIIKMKDGRTLTRKRDYLTCTKRRTNKPPGNTRPRG